MGWVFLEPFNFLLMHSLYTRSSGHLPFARTGSPEQPSHKENSTINQDSRAILKGHLQPVCIAAVNFTKIIWCNTEVTNVISVFDNKIVYTFLLRRVSLPAIALGCEDTIRFSNTIRMFVTSVLHQMISMKCTTAMHTDGRCPPLNTVHSSDGLWLKFGKNTKTSF